MPLAAKKKYGITYLYQPAFIQQGGIFARDVVDASLALSFIQELMRLYRFAEIPLNYDNQLIMVPKSCIHTIRNNYVLPLQDSYEQLYDRYQPGFTKSLKRLKKLKLSYAVSTDFEGAINLYEQFYSRRLPYFSSADFSRFRMLCRKLEENDQLLCRQVRSSNDELLGVVLLIKDKDRLYNVISAITAEGKRLEANYFLYDKVIEEFAGSSFLLDLEGSDVKGIAGFYRKMSPLNQPYPHIKFNKLPAMIRLFKR